jgi:hypothetical protein
VSLIPSESVANDAPTSPSESASARNKDEPPSLPQPPLFLLGQDCRGRWVVQNMAGTCGGLFVARAEALRFIRLEGGNRAFQPVSDVLELKLPQSSQPGSRG